ncbi:hypothetical protein [Flavobacterium sp. CS20]|uniref:hypothetical protein n=1 Tax=Flavobacterium sp. CS20 TaxID=2775246 RepID=UPI001B39E0E5|nr:hypothetical protein [Flavobacterium sp. CS20]QTY27563.1 hypothetical protein IGB25_03155 [Flavobacterium sp. CS20]QTY27592.1 hypothetical protein IGB25_03335 [Flavobacterium sp. CS20]
MKKIVYISVIILIVASCSSQKFGIRKNFKKTDSLAEELFQKNGNSFVITSMYSNFSQVWSYNKKNRIKYDLIKGKIHKIDTTASDFYGNYLSEAQNTFNGILPTNCPELDGGLFLIRMNYNAKHKTIDYNSVNIKCLFGKENNNDFISALAKDVDFINPVWLEN